MELGSDLIPAHPELNAKGHWEHREVVELNERILGSVDRTWHDERLLPDDWGKTPSLVNIIGEIRILLRREFSHASMWGLKDPRLCRLLPLWLEAIAENSAEPLFVFALRHPEEVAQSLARRDGIPKERAYLLWLDHMLEAERASRDYPRVVVSYEKLLADWRRALSPLVSSLGLELSLGEPEIGARIDAFLSPGLRHFSSGSRMGPSTLCQTLAEEAYHAFTDEAAGLSPVIFDKLYSRMEGVSKLVAPWAAQIQELMAAKKTLENKLLDRDALAAEVVRVKATLSWQITKPLRAIWNALSWPWHRRGSPRSRAGVPPSSAA
ncbi:MAG: hypothetical protein ABFE02_00880 [Sulfuricella sp.]